MSIPKEQLMTVDELELMPDDGNGHHFRPAVRVNPGDTWHACSTVGTTVACALQNRPVTTVNELEIQTI